MRHLIALCLLVCGCAPSPETTTVSSVAPSARRSEPSATAPAVVAIAGRSVPFERIGRAPPGGFSPISGRTTGAPTIIVATTQEENASLFSNQRLGSYVTGAPPLADGSAYIAAFAGTKPSSGYSIALQDVRAQNGVVTFWTTQTRPGDMVLPTVTYPIDVIQIAASELARGTRLELRDAGTGALLASVAYCGSTRDLNPITRYDPAGPECVWSAYSRGETAQWLRRTLTIEGGPIIRTLRAVPGGLSEVSVDDRGDGFAHQPGVRSWACAQIARSSFDGADGRSFVWFELSVCTGDGAETSVR